MKVKRGERVTIGGFTGDNALSSFRNKFWK
jgi:hypothetical protein